MAIGIFKIKKEIYNQDIIQGESLNIKLIIEGQGNFDNFIFPDIKISKFELINKKEKKILFYADNGYKGYIEYYFTYKAKEIGDAFIAIDDFIYINNNKKNIIQGNIYNYKIISVIDELNKHNFKLFSKNEIENENIVNIYLYIMIPFIIMFIILFIIMFIKKIRIKYTKILISLLFFSCIKNHINYPDLKKANLFFEKGLFLDAQKEYYKIFKKDNNNSRLNFNLALNSYALHSKELSLFFIKEAIKLDPLNKEYQRFINYLDKENNIFISNEIFYLFNIIIYLLLISVLFLYKKNIILLILNIFFYLIINFVLLDYVYEKTDKVILRENSFLTKIPNDKAEIFIKNNDAKYVKIKSYYNTYYLVEDNKKFFWVKSKDLIIDKDKIKKMQKEDDIKESFDYLDLTFLEKDALQEEIDRKKELEYQEELEEELKRKQELEDLKKQNKEIISVDGSIKLYPIPFSPDGDEYNDSLNIYLLISNPEQVSKWFVDILDPKDKLFKNFTGTGVPPKQLIWNGVSNSGELVQSATDYKIILSIFSKSGINKIHRVTLPIDILIEKRDSKFFIRVSSITFLANSADITDNKKNNNTLDKIAKAIQRFSKYKITVEGHANLVYWQDEERAKLEQVNEAIPLSINRAKSVKNSLIKRGINESRIIIKGVGGADPIFPFNDRMNAWKNRRVEFILDKND